MAGFTSSIIAFAVMAVVCLFGVFSAGAPLQASHGIICVVSGMLMVLLPPRVALSWRWWLMAALFVLCCSLAFLPKSWFALPDWRPRVEALGVDTGSFVTAHPRQTAGYLAGVGITVLMALYLLGHRVSERSQQALVLAFTCGVALYGAFSIGIAEHHWRLAWDPEPSFGLLPNRNHTATLLVMGVLTGIACLAQAARRRQGGMAGMAALAVAVNTGAVLGYCGSRAGVLLMVLGLAVWVAGLDRSTVSRKMVIALSVFALAAAAVFWRSTSAVKVRLTETVDRIVQASPLGDGDGGTLADPSVTTEIDAPFDSRVLIYKDALVMLAHEPWTGVGLGMFRYVFPRYRNASASPDIALHPESDWLMMAAEAGLAATLVLAGLVAVVVAAVVREARRRRGWTLRWGSLIAAMMVPVHGLCDVPGHRVGLAWSALLLVAVSFRVPEAAVAPGRLARLVFRLGGAAVIVAGIFLVRAEWGGGPQSALARPERLGSQARKALLAEQARLKQFTPAELSALPTDASDATLKSAIALVDQALAITPLNPNLHALKGVLALQFDEMDALVDQAFAAQRLLDPIRVNVPLGQAQAWSPIDPSRTATLWAEALRRVPIETRSPAPGPRRTQVWIDIMTQTKGQDELARRALTLAGTDAELLVGWAGHAPPSLLAESMPSLLAAQASPAGADALFNVWRSRDPAKADAFRKAKSE